MNRYFAEFFGTFALVFCGTGAIIINTITEGTVGNLGIALTFGLVVMAMIYSVGEISGAHFNPAVTIGFWISKKFKSKDVLPYLVAQIIGGILASLVLKILFPDAINLGETLPASSAFQSFLLEILLTFFLMFVIINVSTGSKEVGVMAGIAIGGIVGLEAAFAGPITGASMNPARSIAPALVNLNFQHLWIYILAPIIGSILAVYSCRLTKGKDCC